MDRASNYLGMLGKTVINATIGPYGMILNFDDGSSLTVNSTEPTTKVDVNYNNVCTCNQQ